MIPADAKVLIVDDDAASRDMSAEFFRSLGVEVQTFSSGTEFLVHPPEDGPTCVLIELKLPDMTGLELQQELSRTSREIPIVFLTRHGAISACAQAMKRGAVDFFEKPLDERRVYEAVERGLREDLQRRRQSAAQHEACRRLAQLTAREHQVCDSVVAGLLNKQSAGLIGIAESTVTVTRSRMMKKLGLSSVVQLIRLLDTASGQWPMNGSGNGHGSVERARDMDERRDAEAKVKRVNGSQTTQWNGATL